MKTIKCIIRNKNFKAQKEELIRQQILYWMLHNGYKKRNIFIEKSISVIIPKYKHIKKRIDIFYWEESLGKIILLIECKNKNPTIKNFDQLLSYYSIVDPECIVLSNFKTTISIITKKIDKIYHELIPYEHLMNILSNNNYYEDIDDNC